MTNFFNTEQIIFDTCGISLGNYFSLLLQYVCMCMCVRAYLFHLLGRLLSLIFLFRFILCCFFADPYDTHMTPAETVNHARARTNRQDITIAKIMHSQKYNSFCTRSCLRGQISMLLAAIMLLLLLMDNIYF